MNALVGFFGLWRPKSGRRITAVFACIALLGMGLFVAGASPAAAGVCPVIPGDGGVPLPPTGGQADWIGSWTSTNQSTGARYFGGSDAALVFPTNQGGTLQPGSQMEFVTGTTVISAGTPVTGSASCDGSGTLVLDGSVGPVHFHGQFSADGMEITGTHTLTSGGVTYSGSFSLGIVLNGAITANDTSIQTSGYPTPSPSLPVQSSIVSPTSGSMTVLVAKNEQTGLFGYSGSGQWVVQVDAPPATTTDPLQITINVDASIANPTNLVLFRDGVQVPFCASYPTASSTATPDPCVSVLDLSHYQAGPPATGYISAVILSSHTSVWTFGRTSVPSAPRTPSAVASKASAKMKWKAPLIIGAPKLTGYIVTPYIGTKPLPPRKFTSTATTETIGGLTKGQHYTFRVAAKNKFGVGPKSAATKVVTPN
jgi:hypothetical protein